MLSSLNIDGIHTADCRELHIGDCTVRWCHLDKVDSTMDRAAAHAASGGAPWTVISADTQTAGRGTQGRDWFSPGGRGFWVSVLLPLPDRIEHADGYTLHAAQALADAVQTLTGLVSVIKHPNDVMVGGRKLAGILIESASRGEDPVSLILGMGINLSQTADEFILAGLPEATSVCLETGIIPCREQLLTAFLTCFRARIGTYHDSAADETGSGA